MYLNQQVSKLQKYPGRQIATDSYGPSPSDEKLFVLMNMYSHYPIVEIMKNMSVQSAIKNFNKIFSIFAYPKKY